MGPSKTNTLFVRKTGCRTTNVISGSYEPFHGVTRSSTESLDAELSSTVKKRYGTEPITWCSGHPTGYTKNSPSIKITRYGFSFGQQVLHSFSFT